MSFSSGLLLTDLNDYISPSQACIKPVEVKQTSSGVQSTIKIDDAGQYYEVTHDGVETRLETASISLNDCLACSGCITSAESVLISMQSHEELIRVLQENRTAEQPRHIVVSISPQTRASLATKYGLTPLQTMQRLVFALKNMGVHHVLDTSFSRDFSLLESAREFTERFRRWRDDQVNTHVSEAHGMPMLASACPGWICYVEKTHGFLVPYLSRTKSPQQIMGSLVKDYLAKKLHVSPTQIYHVCAMPCYDKKLEASRQDFYNELMNVRDVDCVISTGELEKLLLEASVQLDVCQEAPIDTPFVKAASNPVTGQMELLGTEGTGSGGYLEYIMSYAARELFHIDHINVDKGMGVTIRTVRNADFREVILEDANGTPLLSFAAVYGFRNIQNLVRKMKTRRAPYHYVEVMACPSGCINGGGQIKPPESIPAKEWITRVDAVYRSLSSQPPEHNSTVLDIYREWLGEPGSERALSILRTQYRAVEEKAVNPLAVNW